MVKDTRRSKRELKNICICLKTLFLRVSVFSNSIVMKKILFLLLFCLLGFQYSLAGPILLEDLRCENLKNPLGIDNITPHFSWKVLCDIPMSQEYYEYKWGQIALSCLGEKLICGIPARRNLVLL